MSPRAVVVAHPEALAAEGIAAALARYPGLVPVGIATEPDQLLAAASRADAVALDARLERSEEVAKELVRRGVRVIRIVGTEREEPTDDGVRVSRDAPLAFLASALAPGVVVDGERLRRLTARERQVLSLVAKGLPGKQVARLLGISVKTVEQHKTRIFGKLGVQSQAAAVAVAAQGSAPWMLSTI
ncbi:MAG: LuxR family transcriptional regulator [Candidatus Velamenicoccus archaeovorus]